MRKTFKQICLYSFIIAAILLFHTIPEEVVSWIDKHIAFVWIAYILAWLGYSFYDRHYD